jgi:nucleotide-binding universal stress UspA family protein
MFRRILVPLDGSMRAEQALPVAKRIAQASHGELILLRVISPAQFFPSLRTPAILAESIRHAELYLKALSASLEFPDVITHVLQGPAASTILAAIPTLGTDIIVMSSHGASANRRWIIGSVANKLLRTAPVPVLVLQDQEAFPLRPDSQTNRPFRLLVTLDGSAYAKAALEPAAQLAAALAHPQQGEIHLLRVIKPSPLFDAQKEIYLQKDTYSLQTAKKYLSRITTHLLEGFAAPTIAQQRLAVTWSVATSDDTAQAILQIAEHGSDDTHADTSDGYDLIAMSSHGRGGLARLTMGSITERVLSSTRLPFLVVHTPLASSRPTQKAQTKAQTKVVVQASHR